MHAWAHCFINLCEAHVVYAVYMHVRWARCARGRRAVSVVIDIKAYVGILLGNVENAVMRRGEQYSADVFGSPPSHLPFSLIHSLLPYLPTSSLHQLSRVCMSLWYMYITLSRPRSLYIFPRATPLQYSSSHTHTISGGLRTIRLLRTYLRVQVHSFARRQFPKCWAAHVTRTSPEWEVARSIDIDPP